jgi:hypothetical protein
MDLKDVIVIILDKRCSIVFYERVLMYNIHSKFLCCNFNVSNTKNNARAKLSRYV